MMKLLPSAACLLAVLWLSPAADAATITVNTTAQSPGASGDCTLGEAIQAANTNAAVDGCAAGSPSPTVDVIVVPAGTYNLTDIGNPDTAEKAGLPTIRSAIEIQGAGRDATIIERSAAAPSFRIFTVRKFAEPTSLKLANLTVRRGTPYTIDLDSLVTVEDSRVEQGSIAGQGPGLTAVRTLFVNSGISTVGHTTVDASTFTDSGIGATGAHGVNWVVVRITNSTFIRGAIGTEWAKGTGSSVDLEVTDCSFTGRTGATWGGGLYLNNGRAVIRRVTVSNNSAVSGGGIYAGDSDTTIIDSTISGNSAQAGGGINVRYSRTKIINTTISGNRSTGSGGGVLGGGKLYNSSIVNNVADSDGDGTGLGGGIYAVGSLAAGATRLTNTLVAGNRTGTPVSSLTLTDTPDPVAAASPLTYVADVRGHNPSPDCGILLNSQDPGIWESGGYNLIADATGCSFPAGAGDLLGTAAAPIDPRIGVLQNNGGTTLTHALAADSPARNAGNPLTPGSTADACPTTDQRGVARPDGARCDIGAYEGSGGIAVSSFYNLALTDALPSSVTFESVSSTRGTCTGGQTVTCNLGMLAYSEQALVTIVVRPRVAGTLTNTVEVRKTGSADVVASATATTTVQGDAARILGRLTDTFGTRLARSSVTLTGSATASKVADTNGDYEFVVPAGGTYTVTPSRMWHTFTPASRTFANVTGDVSADFVGTPDTGLVLGTGSFSNEGGWFVRRGAVDTSFAHEAWARLPWPTYNATGGGIHPALGDVDNDGFQEVVLGTGPGGNGWLAVLDDARSAYPIVKWLQVPWGGYNAANGETFPALGNLDSDPAAEIVVGLGPGGGGWFLVFDDASTDYAFLGWRQVEWASYAANGDGATHPAIANLDGVGPDEIVVGLGQGGYGWMEVFNAGSPLTHRAWVQVPWADYNTANGTTWPAAGDVDGDGLAEIVAGLGLGGHGWLAAFDDADHGFAITQWIGVQWEDYNASVGETHPALGNVDTDPAAELVIGFAAFAGEGGWFQVRNDAASAFAPIAWVNIGWEAFRLAGGALFPAMIR